MKYTLEWKKFPENDPEIYRIYLVFLRNGNLLLDGRVHWGPNQDVIWVNSDNEEVEYFSEIILPNGSKY